MFWRGIHKFSHIEVAPGGASYGFGNLNTLGRTYFVNNITGSSVNDGRRWDRAVAQPSQAIILSEAFRKDALTNNKNIRNTIVIQGTKVPYTALAALPSYCDLIGLGAIPWGNGEGIAVINAGISGNGSEDSDGMSGGADGERGLNLFNLQINGEGAAFYAIDIVKWFRCLIEDCFIGAGPENADAVIAAAIRVQLYFGGNIIRHCSIGSNNGSFACAIGIDMNTCDIANNTLIEKNQIQGTVFGVKIKALCNDHSLLGRDNSIFSGQGAILPNAVQCGMHGKWINNFIIASTTFSEHDARQCCGNTEVKA